MIRKINCSVTNTFACLYVLVDVVLDTGWRHGVVMSFHFMKVQR